MSRRAMAVVLVTVVLLIALMLSARWNPVYQSRALVSVGPVSSEGSNALQQDLALARSRTVRLAVQAHRRSTARVDVGVVDEGSLEFRVRSRDRTEAAGVANGYAEAYVELRRQQLLEEGVNGEGRGLDRLPYLPSEGGPSVVIPARPARSPLSAWPTEAWVVAGMVLIAAALAVPSRDSAE